MNRDRLAFVVVAVVAIAVIAVAASSLDSAHVQSGFGIGPGSGTQTNTSAAASPPSAGAAGGFGPTGTLSGVFGGAFGSASGGDGGSGSVPTIAVLAVVVGVAAVSVVLIAWATSGDPLPSPASESFADDDGVNETAQTDPHEVVAPANEVYRAWWELVCRLDVSRSASRSPAEFATAAVDVGFDPETVAELTGLFRTVRYGDAPVTDDAKHWASLASDRIRTRGSADEETDP